MSTVDKLNQARSRAEAGEDWDRRSRGCGRLRMWLCGGRKGPKMRTFLVVLSIAIAALAAPSFAAGDEAAPVGLAAAEDGYVAPVCDDPDISTLAVSDCTGAEAVPSLDPDDVANPPSVEEIGRASC